MRVRSLEAIPDLWKATYELVTQIPKGMVSTYGLVARALGDVAASRFVGMAMNSGRRADDCPFWRVVLSDGYVCRHTGDSGLRIKADRLKAEGVRVSGRKVQSLNEVLFDDYTTGHPLRQLKRRQNRLREQLEIPSSHIEFMKVAGVDVAYGPDDSAYAALALFDAVTGKQIDTVVTEGRASFPYVPTYLAFRELPLLSTFERDLAGDTVLMYDGNGILHPQGLGIASHAGIVFGCPTIGVAKSLLCGTLPGRVTHGARKVVLSGSTVGYAFSEDSETKPVFVSPGSGISMRQSLQIVRKYSRYRIPEPIRQAHLAAEKARWATTHK